MSANLKKAKAFIDGMSQLSRGGFNPEAVVAQACLETGWFHHMAAPHNYFGMKCPRKWTGEFQSVQTVEFIDGKEVVIEDKFCAFDSVSHGLTHYVQKIIELYPYAWTNRFNPRDFFKGLQNGLHTKAGWTARWSTDPNYQTKLTSIYDQIQSKKDFIDMLAPRMKEYLDAMHGEN